MFRAFLYVLIGILILTFIRMVAGILSKGLGQLFEPSPSGRAANSPRNAMPQGGELKRDPVCGTFVPTATSIQATLRGEIHYFCSAECRNKFMAAS